MTQAKECALPGCGKFGAFEYRDQSGELVWYCERHRLAHGGRTLAAMAAPGTRLSIHLKSGTAIAPPDQAAPGCAGTAAVPVTRESKPAGGTQIVPIPFQRTSVAPISPASALSKHPLPPGCRAGHRWRELRGRPGNGSHMRPGRPYSEPLGDSR
jgi:hypothetical protein